jgi:hypothetical protein
MELYQPVLNGRGSQGNELWSLYNSFADSNTYGLNTEGTVNGHAYDGNDTAYRAGGYYDGSLNIEGRFCSCSCVRSG